MELLNFAITIYGPYATSVAVSQVTQPTQFMQHCRHKDELLQLLAVPCSSEITQSASVCKTKWQALSTMSGHEITMSPIYCMIFTGCQYGVGSPELFARDTPSVNPIMNSALESASNAKISNQDCRSLIFKFGSGRMELSSSSVLAVWNFLP